MFSLSFDSNHRVLLAQFTGVLTSEDIKGLDKALGAFVARHGVVRGILDFSSVQANAVPRSFLTWRARLPQILLGQERVIVAPNKKYMSWHVPTPLSSAISGTSKDRLCAPSTTRAWRSILNNPTFALY